MSGRLERELYCRRCTAFERHGDAGQGDAVRRPFALPGAHATYAPDRACDVRHLRIEVEVDFEARAVTGVCTQSLIVINDGPTRLELNAEEMTVAEVVEKGAGALSFSHDGRILAVPLGERKEGQALELEIRYRATPRRGLYFIHPDAGYPERPVQVWSQGQDEDNRRWFPCFDHPHEKATSEVIATVPERMFALSNGTLADERHDATKKTRTFHYRHDVPHSSYLVTLVAGEYQVVRDRLDETEVLYYVRPGQEAAARRSFQRTPEMMRLFSALTGQRYPYPRYSQITVAEFIFGGMENTSATTITDQTLHDERAALDFSSEPLVAHELAHQWFGDLLTCRDWSQGWLNEGFATYLELVWKEHAHGRDEADYDRLADLEAYLDEDARRYRRPIVANTFHEPIDVFDRHLYEKGSCVLHMLRTELGDPRFWKGIRHYVHKHKGGSVETRDLVRAIEEATGYNGDRFFDQWVFRAGFPTLEVEYRWEDEEQRVRFSVKQTQTVDRDTPLFAFPVILRLCDAHGSEDVRLFIREAQETFLIPRARAPEQAIFDAGGQLLKTIEMKKPDALWRAELERAATGLDRVFAARALGKAADPRAIDALSAALDPGRQPFWAVRGEAALALGAIRTDRAREVVATALGKEPHPKARRLFARALGAFRHDERAADALEAPLQRDASYFVEAESATAMARTRSPRAFERLKAAMQRPSYLDAIASSCLSGFAELRDERGIELALAAACYGRPVVARRAAIAALGVLGAEHASRRRQIRETLCELLEDPDFRARIAAVEALRVLGDTDAIGPLERAVTADLDGRVRRRAREVARALEGGAEKDARVQALRDSLEKLEAESRTLRDRVAALEVQRPSPAPSPPAKDPLTGERHG
jgi:aminopeptidase N